MDVRVGMTTYRLPYLPIRRRGCAGPHGLSAGRSGCCHQSWNQKIRYKRAKNPRDSFCALGLYLGKAIPGQTRFNTIIFIRSAWLNADHEQIRIRSKDAENIQRRISSSLKRSKTKCKTNLSCWWIRMRFLRLMNRDSTFHFDKSGSNNWFCWMRIRFFIWWIRINAVHSTQYGTLSLNENKFLN